MGLRSGDWLGHSMTLMCFFLSHSFVAIADVFGSLSCWKTHPQHIFSVLAERSYQDFTEHGPIHFSLYAVTTTSPLGRETPKHNASTSMLDSGDGVLVVIVRIPPPPNKAHQIDTKELDLFHLTISPSAKYSLNHPGVLQTSLYMGHSSGPPT